MKNSSKKIEPQATITFVGKKPDMFQHADFTNRHFNGLIDLYKATNVHGDIIYEAVSTASYTFAYADLKGFKWVGGRYMVVTEHPSGTVWVMKPKWILEQKYLKGQEFRTYAQLLDKLSLYKVSGDKIAHLVGKGIISIDNQQKE